MAYEDLERLQHCTVCGSRSYWFDGVDWQCQGCVPCTDRCPITVELHPQGTVTPPANGTIAQA